MESEAARMTSELPQWIMVILGVMGFLVTICATTGTIVWTASRTKDALQKQISTHKEETDKAISDVKADMTGRFTSVYMQSNQELQKLRQESSDIAAALKDDLRRTEIFIRDEFVRKETFNMVIDRIIGEIKSIGSDMAQRVLRVETKLDGIRFRALMGPVKPDTPDEEG